MRKSLLLLIPLVVACGDRTRQADGADTATVTVAPPPAATPTFTPALGVDLSAMQRTRSGAYYRDMNPGNGPVADSGKTVSLHYRGQLPDGTQFDASQPPAPPIVFELGARQVVRGFDEGVTGMRQGGRRLLVIPPELGYGAAGNGPVPPNAYMVFTLDLVNVR